MTTIRVLIADDHHLVRAGIRSLLEKHEHINVIGEAEDGQQAVTLARKLEPDVVIMDIGMPRLNGLEATARIRTLVPACQIVVLSMHAQRNIVEQALYHGALAYLLKSSLEDQLLTAIEAALGDQRYLSPELADIIGDFEPDGSTITPVEPFDLLTPRERQLLQLIAEGHTNREAAEQMGIGVRTVETHRANLMDKLNVHDVPGLVRIAIKHGLVQLDS